MCRIACWNGALCASCSRNPVTAGNPGSNPSADPCWCPLRAGPENNRRLNVKIYASSAIKQYIIIAAKMFTFQEKKFARFARANISFHCRKFLARDFWRRQNEEMQKYAANNSRVFYYEEVISTISNIPILKLHNEWINIAWHIFDEYSSKILISNDVSRARARHIHVTPFTLTNRDVHSSSTLVIRQFFPPILEHARKTACAFSLTIEALIAWQAETRHDYSILLVLNLSDAVIVNS